MSYKAVKVSKNLKLWGAEKDAHYLSSFNQRVFHSIDVSDAVFDDASH